MTPTPKQVRITLPNHLSYLPHALSVVRITAQMAGFQEADITRLELGVEEACANVIHHAFAPGEEATFELIVSTQALGILVTIKEKGLPYDFSLLPEYNKDQLQQDLNTKGLGTFLMKSLLDEVTYVNLGKEGREVRLLKYRSDQPIDQLMKAAELQQSRIAMEEEPLPKGSVQYEVRRMLPEEAVEVSRGAYCSYGYTYVLDHVYYPDRVRELNASDELISFVAVTGDGTVIGHGALEVEERDPLVPQLGVAFTMPKYRGQGCLNRLTPALIAEAIEKNFYALYARGVTTHPYSQKSILKFGFSECAILLSSGIEREYKGIIEGKSQRESVAIFFQYLHAPGKIELYAPEAHQDIIRFIYGKLGVPVEFLPPAESAKSPSGESTISMHPELANRVAKLTVHHYGADVIDQIRGNLQSLCLERFETIYLYLPLNEAVTAALAPAFEALGFYFAGVMPGSEGRDCLILQYQNNYLVDFSKVMLASETGQKILDYIRELAPFSKKPTPS